VNPVTANPVTWMILAGAASGGGLVLIMYGLRPARPALATVLDVLSRPRPAPVTARRRLDVALAGPLQRFGLPGTRTRADLSILDRDPAEYLAHQVVFAVSGTVILGVLPVLWGVGGQLPLWLAVLGAGLAVKMLAIRLHAAAEYRREQMRETLSTLLDLAGGALAGGAGIEQAIDDTMGELSGWAATRLQRELAAAAQTRGRQRISTWDALKDFSHQIGVDELAELATAIEQAATGSPIAETMATVAHNMRTKATADMERQANARSAQMSIPIMLYGLGYLIFLLYGAMGAITTGLIKQ
jgi:tight adherence protein C